MRIKHLITLSILLMISLLACRDENSSMSTLSEAAVPLPEEGKILHAMGDFDYPPFEYNDENGKPSGFNIDILRSVARVMNLNIEIKLGRWSDVRSELENGRIDILAGMFRTPERMKKVDFTIPHFISTYVIFIRKGSDIKGIQDIKGKTVLVQKDDLGHDFIKENGTAGEIITRGEVADAIISLSGGEGDCAIAAAMQGQIIIRQKGIKNLTYITVPLVQRSYCMAVKKGDAELLAKLNEGLNVLKNTGEYDKIYEKWFNVYEQRGMFDVWYLKLLLYTFAGLLIVIVLIYIWNISLKRKIREMETLFQTVFETSPYSISLAGTDNGRYSMVNRAFEQLTGFSAEEVIGKTAEEVGLELRDIDYDAMMKKLNIRKRIDNERIIIRHRNGEERYCLFSVVFIELRGEEYAVTMTVDTTEMKKLEEQLRQSQKMEVVGQLAGGVAHDFNNMLAGITGGAELLMRNIEPGSKAANYADMILKGAERASELTTKLLAFSRIGKMVMKNVDIHDTILSAVTILERSIDKKISIITDFSAETPVVKGDVVLLQNAFLNLALNSRDAMHDGGEIRITTENIRIESGSGEIYPSELSPGLYLKIIFSDTGKGISGDIIDRIFEPFFTTKPVGKGTGLGLSAVYGTVHEHDGIIKVSSSEKSGSVFSIFLPAGENTGDNDKEISADLPHYRGAVLVIDDEPLVRNTAEGFLHEMGFTVFTADSGHAGIKIMNERGRDILFVVLDMVMPGMSGPETLKRLREIDKDVKVIFSSGFTRQKVLVEEPGLDDFLFVQKPYRLKDFAQIVKTMMSRI